MLGKKNTKMQRDKKDWQWVAGFAGLKICNKFIKSEDLVSSNLLVKIFTVTRQMLLENIHEKQE